MKQFLSMIVLFTVLFIPHCDQQKDNPVIPDNLNNNGNNNENNNFNVRIKGTITGMKKSGDSLSLADAKKVLVYSQYYYTLTEISSDTFSVPANFGTGVALIFLTGDNHYIGHLSSRGLNMLPLGNLVNGEHTTIDLSTLTLVGKTVIPSHDPFGNAIVISDQELQTLKTVDGYFESIAKNLDADNDGLPDVLSNKQLLLATQFNLFGGHWGHNDTLPTVMDTAHYYANYGLEIGGGSALSFYAANIILSGPEQDPQNDIILWGFMKAPACGGGRAFIASFARMENAPPGAPWGTSFLPFRKGTYRLTLDWDNVYSMEYSCLDIKENLIHVTPTLHTDSLGRLLSITFEYKLPNGATVNPASILSSVMIQLSSRYTQFLSLRMNDVNGKPYFSELVFDVPVDISTLESILIGYDDYIGNHYSIGWK
ncbi:MAG: hypothetical protein ACYC09_10490 [Bacteroidota bacterium]